MIIPDDVICKRCKKVFCCSDCREKHEKKAHAHDEMAVAIEDVDNNGNKVVFNPLCPICQEQQMVLYPDMGNEILAHIADHHLPLNCEKCLKVYSKIDDLMEFTKCFKETHVCQLQIDEDSKSSLKTHHSNGYTTTISTQTSPFKIDADFDETNAHLTPISMINLRWKAKSKMSENFISDSVSSIRNISSISNSSIRRSIGGINEVITSTKGKLVRSTSTPLPADILTKVNKEHLFQASAQVSSIYHSGSESDISPPIITPSAITPSCRTIDKMSRYQKVRNRPKIPVTPLRQVMSKSIQKAIAEHGMVSSPITYRKKILDSIDSSGSAVGSPLDLRMSPVVRRSHSEIIESKSHLEAADLSSILQCSTKSVLLSSKKTTESIMITATRTSSLKNSSQDSQASVYKTCRSVEIITETELNEINIEPKRTIVSALMAPITPRIAGAPVNKKIINFETPKPTTETKALDTTVDDVFLTPNSTPQKSNSKRFDRSKMRNIETRNILNNEEVRNEEDEVVEEEDDIETLENEVFEEQENPKKKKQVGRKLWSLVSSVMRFSSRHKNNTEKDADLPVVVEKNNSSSLIKRCASFAGSLVKSKPEDNDLQPLKRKRTYTDVSAVYRSQSQFNQSDLDSSAASKRFRIQGLPAGPTRRNSII